MAADRPQPTRKPNLGSSLLELFGGGVDKAALGVSNGLFHAIPAGIGFKAELTKLGELCEPVGDQLFNGLVAALHTTSCGRVIVP